MPLRERPGMRPLYVELPVEVFDWLAGRAKLNRRAIRDELLAAVKVYRKKPEVVPPPLPPPPKRPRGRPRKQA